MKELFSNTLSILLIITRDTKFDLYSKKIATDFLELVYKDNTKILTPLYVSL